MRLKSIKLAGFKSFVDPTTVHFPGNMAAVVGPNGCGKSNIIDAVRWVMGESSARNLRGESMADVIFNGSVNRKPVGQAAIELVFDNSDGGIGGEYAGYAEISTRRQVNRDAQSEYFLNGAKCRRRDITDIFLGTGLGPRSYAIIEQGMISRLIESKPEELRVFIEEAAGISKYKERRRETESRMRRTLENLERLTDLRDELARQLQHLQRQAQAAERYKALKAEERELGRRLMAAQWRAIEARESAVAREAKEQEVRLEAVHAEQQKLATALEKHRVTHGERNEALNRAQGRFYTIGGEVSRIEQDIRHRGERAQQLEADVQATRAGLAQAERHLHDDGARLHTWEAQLQTLGPDLEACRAASAAAGEALAAAEGAMQSWQSRWDDFNQKAAVPRQQAEVQQSRIQHLEHSLQRLRRRLGALEQERESHADDEAVRAIAALTAELREAERILAQHGARGADLEADVAALRDERRQAQEQLNERRLSLQVQRGRRASLEALQQAAKARADGEGVAAFLCGQELSARPRVLDALQVEARWQNAVETVLGGALQGICVDGIEAYGAALEALPKGDVALFEPARPFPSPLPADSLAHRLAGDTRIAGLLAGVRCAQSRAEAEARRRDLAPGESLVTPEGIWFGRNWVRVHRAEASESGVLARQRELEALEQSVQAAQDAEAQGAEALASAESRLAQAEQRLRKVRGEADAAAAQRADGLARLRAEEARQEQVLKRRERLERELRDLHAQSEQEQAAIAAARAALADAIERMDGDSADRDKRLRERDELRRTLDSARAEAQRCRDAAHQAALSHQSLVTQSETIRDALARSRKQVETMGQRLADLENARTENSAPVDGLRRDLEAQLAQRHTSEGALTAARQALAEIEHTQREAEQERLGVEQRVAASRERLESRRLALRELELQRETLAARLEEAGGELAPLLAALPEIAPVDAWQRDLEGCAQRLARLGPINLAAVDEYRQQSERKQYLDAQHEDLETALATLEAAIRKIDRETRSRFKETFDRVNSGLQELFPRVFGGGSASLEMTGQDLLDTGVSILARPPGKKNATIHLLSGGEKALTAIALVFSIFQLNPAPFCMLDEVDAPLDDANVGRYARMVREMSEKVQFVFITHNKITMEMADHLMGVTMQEPGVSRLVSVDVDEAAELAAS